MHQLLLCQHYYSTVARRERFTIAITPQSKQANERHKRIDRLLVTPYSLRKVYMPRDPDLLPMTGQLTLQALLGSIDIAIVHKGLKPLHLNLTNTLYNQCENSVLKKRRVSSWELATRKASPTRARLHPTSTKLQDWARSSYKRPIFLLKNIGGPDHYTSTTFYRA